MKSGQSSKALTDFLSLSLGEIAGKIGGFLVFTYLARALTPDMYGGVELAYSLLALFTVFIDFGFGPIAAKVVAQKPEQAPTIASQVIGARLILVLICLPIMLALAYTLKIPAEISTLIATMSAAIVFLAFNQKWLLQGLEKMVFVSWSQAMKMLVFMALTIPLVRNTQDIYLIGIIEIFVTALVAVYFLSLQYWYIGNVSVAFSNLRNLASQAKSIGLSNVLWSFTQSIPFLVLTTFSVARETAWFGAAFRISTAIMTFTLIYHFNMFPTVTRRLSVSRAEYLRYSNPSVRITAWGGIFVALVTTLAAEPICTLVFGLPYSESADTLSILIWSIPVTLVSGHARWVLVASGKQRFPLYAIAGGCLTCGCLCIPFVLWLGAEGAAIAVLVSFIVIWILTQYFVYRHVFAVPVGAVLLPAATALLLVVLQRTLEIEAGLTLSIFTLIFAAVGFFFDTQLRRDIPELIRIKSDVRKG